MCRQRLLRALSCAILLILGIYMWQSFPAVYHQAKVAVDETIGLHGNDDKKENVPFERAIIQIDATARTVPGKITPSWNEGTNEIGLETNINGARQGGSTVLARSTLVNNTVTKGPASSGNTSTDETRPKEITLAVRTVNKGTTLAVRTFTMGNTGTTLAGSNVTKETTKAGSNVTKETTRAGSTGTKGTTPAQSNSTKENILETVRCSQEERVQRMRRVCEGREQKLNFTDDMFWQELLVDTKHKAIYCVMPKVACSTMKQTLVNLTGFVPKPGQKIRVHGYDIERYGLHYMPYYPPNERQKIYESYFKFIIARNPFDRLVSAHVDKFLEGNLGHYLTGEVRSLYRRKGDPDYALEHATFEEFATLLSEAYKSHQNYHWMTYEDLCFPCSIKYDFVLKLETMADDMNDLLEKLTKEGHSNHTAPRANSRRRRTSTEVLLEQFRDLPKDVVKKLYDVYRADFEVFGYTYNTENMTGKCESDRKYGGKCC